MKDAVGWRQRGIECTNSDSDILFDVLYLSIKRIDSLEGSDSERYDTLFPKMSQGIKNMIEWLKLRRSDNAQI